MHETSHTTLQPYQQPSSPAHDFLTEIGRAEPTPTPSPSSSSTVLVQIAQFKAASASPLDTSSGNRNSVIIDPENMDVSTAIALLQELKKKASPEDLVALHKALLPTSIFEPARSIPVTENDETMVSPLIRRKSLLPAGIATRSASSAESLRRRSAQERSKASKARDQYEQSRQPQSDVSNATSKEQQNKLLSADLFAEIPRIGDTRCTTPSDMEYQIGSFKQGTLRITNGAVSPDPSIMLKMSERASSVDLRSVDGYFTADEGRSSIDTFRQSSIDNESIRNRATGRRQACRQKNAAKARAQSVPRLRSRSSASISADKRLSIDDSETESEAPPVPARKRPPLQSEVSKVAQDYMSECDLSPGPFTQKPGSIANFEQRLSTVESASEVSLVDESTSRREEALRRLTGGPASSAQPYHGSPSTASAIDRPLELAPTQSRPELLTTKSDSGYSSETSHQPEPEDCPLPGKEVQATSEIGMASSSRSCYTVASDADKSASPLRIHAASSPIVNDEATLSPHRGKWSNFAQHAMYLQQPMQRNSMPIMTRPPGSSSSSVPTIATTQSSPAEGTNIEKIPRQPRRLQKNRASSGPQTHLPLMVQSVTDVRLSALPTVPKEVSINFSRRLTTTPKMAHLERTYNSVEDVSQENLAAQAFEQQVEIRFPTPNPESPGNEHGRSYSRSIKASMSDDKEAETAPLQKKKSFFRLRGRSKSRSKSQSRAEHQRKVSDDEPALPIFTDFGTVAQSLGGSPYDIATREFPEYKSDNITPKGPRAMFHPHEISTELSRPSSSDGAAEAPVVGMSEQAASAFARMRSRERADIVSRDEKSRARSQSRPRPRQSFEDRAEEEANNVSPPATAARKSTPNDKRSHHTYTGGLNDARPYDDEQSPVKTPVRPQQQEQRQSSTSVSPRIRTDDLGSVAAATPPKPRTPQNISAESLVESPAAKSPSHEAMHPGWPGWENQARLWRERRQSLGYSLPKAGSSPHIVSQYKASDSSAERALAPESPSIVISRYVTPTTAENTAHSALAQDLEPEEQKEDGFFPNVHNLNPTDSRPAKDDVPRTDSAISTSSYHTAATSSTKRSSTQPSPHLGDSYHPYRQSNSQSFERLIATAAQQPRSIPDQDRLRKSASKSPDALFDRYSGGLDYGWERGAGFAGSAGTRTSESKAKRKSKVLAESFGVDLSDVPVLLMKAK